jgi:hypothetical protein
MEETKKEYSELEQKILKRGYENFKKELREASIPMLRVLEKYGIHSNYHPLLKKICLKHPGVCECKSAVSLPDNSVLSSLNEAILHNFMEEVKELKKKVNDLEI